MSALEIKNLSKSYGEKTVISDFSLTVDEGEKIAVMGYSGSGKTTLLRIIAGLEKPDSGSVVCDKKISFMFQENRLCDDFSPVSNIRFVTGNSLSDGEIKATLNKLGLTENLDKPVKTMSGGMKRRVAIARAISAPCDLLIMDEPFKGLDEQLKVSVMKYLKEILKDKTLILVTHDNEEATFLTDKITMFF